MEKAKAEILISNKIKKLHPVVEIISSNLAGIEPIQCIRISPDFLQASSEVSKSRVKIPITKPGHRSAIGLSLIIDIDHKESRRLRKRVPGLRANHLWTAIIGQ